MIIVQECGFDMVGGVVDILVTLAHTYHFVDINNMVTLSHKSHSIHILHNTNIYILVSIFICLVMLKCQKIKKKCAL